VRAFTGSKAWLGQGALCPRTGVQAGKTTYDLCVARRIPSVATRLVTQSQDAALAGVQVFNNPLIKFKSETFIVLMNIAWTRLLHAHYRRMGIEYRYYRQLGKRRRFERTGMEASSTGI
jgi:hypothetical protein